MCSLKKSLFFPVARKKNDAEDQKHYSYSNVCPVSVKENRWDKHQQARK
jgi:hypothetical protein